MKNSRFSEEQILFALKLGGADQPVADVRRQMGISEATHYVWKKRYGYLRLLDVRELRQLRDENARLKRLVVDLTLDRHILQEVIKKDLTTARRRVGYERPHISLTRETRRNRARIRGESIYRSTDGSATSA